MRCAIIGGSGHYGYLLEAMRRRGSLDSLCGIAPGSPQEDITGVVRQAGKSEYRPKVYTDWRSLLDQEQPELVAVNPWFCDIAPITLELIQRNIPCFSEKPLATTWEQWEALCQAGKTQPDAKVCAMFGIRAHPAFAAAKKACDTLGDIRLAHGQKSYKLGHRGPVYQLREHSGGMMPWVGIHAMDWVYWTTGKHFLSAASAHSTVGNGGNGDLEASAAALFTMEGGTLATISADYLRPAASATHGDDQLRLTGTQGTLFIRKDQAFLEPCDGPIQQLPMDAEGSLCVDYMEALERNQPAPLSLRDALHVTAAALAAREAADTGKIISVPEL